LSQTGLHYACFIAISILLLRKAKYEKRKALDLLHQESLKYCRTAQPVTKMPLQGDNAGGSCSSTETIPPSQSRVPPSLPATAPIGAAAFAGPSFPSSPIYRPDIDLSLPPNFEADRNQNTRTVQVFCGSNKSQVVAYPPVQPPVSPSRSPLWNEPKRASTSVNLILQPNSEQVVPYVSFTSASMDSNTGRHSQLKITISPQGGSVSAMRSSATSGIGLMPTMSPNWYLGGSPTSVTSHSRDDVPHLDQQRPVTSSTAQQSEQTGWITSQCEKRERMRRSLEEDKSQLQKLRKKVEHLQEELTRDKRLLQSSRPRHERSLPTEPSVVAMVDQEKLRNEIRSLQLDCQQMYQQIDDSSGELDGNHVGPAVAPTHRSICLDEEDGGWNCNTCTFRNHPALNKCEECEMARPQWPRNDCSTGSGIHFSFSYFSIYLFLFTCLLANIYSSNGLMF